MCRMIFNYVLGFKNSLSFVFILVATASQGTSEQIPHAKFKLRKF